MNHVCHSCSTEDVLLAAVRITVLTQLGELMTSGLPVIRNERQPHNGIEGPALPFPAQRIMAGPSRSVQLLRLI
jgi:hypothetical protein